MKNLRNLFAGIFLGIAAMFGIDRTQTDPSWELTVLECGTQYWSLDGALSGTRTDDELRMFAEQLDIRMEIRDYADPDTNILGTLQRRHVITFYPEGPVAGAHVIWHGGGGDRGFVDNFGNPKDPKSLITLVSQLVEAGYIVALPEYRRGWMDPTFCDPCPWNTSDLAYNREEEAARLSFEDAALALQNIWEHEDKRLKYLLSGTSFGGSQALYASVMDEDINPAVKQQIVAVLGGYTGINPEDKIHHTDIPLLLVGGLDDPIVPADRSGAYYSDRAMDLLGIRGLFQRYTAMSGTAAGVFSTGTDTPKGYQPMGHGYGLFENGELEVYALFLKWAKNPQPALQYRQLEVDERGRPTGFKLVESAQPNPVIPDC